VHPQASSLNSYIPWTSVLPVLGVEVHGAALPAVVQCPLCRHRTLAVYKEPARPGQWYHCAGCDFAGDGVELVAAEGGISTGSALLKLAARGLDIPEPLLDDEALEWHAGKVAFRGRVQAFWAAARASTHDSGETGPAQRRLGIAPGAMLAPEWPRRGGRFVGHCKAGDVERLLRPGSVNYRLKAGRTGVNSTGWNPLFVGPGWRDLLVVPYRDLPGRISGFLLVGREARWPDDFVFATAVNHQSGSHGAIGVVMLEAALALHGEFAAAVVVVEDPVLAVRIQLRHLVSRDVPLPVVGAWGRPEGRSIWPSLPRRDLVHWSPTPDGRLVARARRSGGRVALAPAGAAVVGHLERSRSVMALRAMLAAARPWDAALEAILGRLAPAKAEELVLGLKLRPDETTGFLRACADDTRARLAALFGDVGRPRGVSINGKTVVESGGVWRLTRNGELVCDAVLRIEQVIRSGSGAVSYRGRIEYRGQTLPFWAPDTEIERDPLRWIRAKVGQAGLGEVAIGGICWSKHILTIAQQFEPPQSARGLDVVGWDDELNAFALPRFLLRADGAVATPDYVVPPERVLPGAGLAPPAGLTPGARVALAWGDEANELFWAVAACLLADILAPALGLPRCSTALVGTGAVAVGQAAARALGCLEAPTAHDGKRRLAREAGHLLGVHRWPILVRRRDHEDTTRVVHAQSLGLMAAGVVAATGALPAESLSVVGGWHVVEGPRPVAVERVREHGGGALLGYLKDLCERRLALDVDGSLLEAVHADLAAWYGRVAGSRCVAGSRKYIRADDPAARADRFGRLVARLVDCGELRLAAPGHQRGTAVTRLAGDRVHIPKWGLNEGLERKRGIALDADAISALLRGAGVLLEERDQDYMAGWVVPERWLRQHIDDHRRGGQSDLHIVTT
jgi:hypothetical protein